MKRILIIMDDKEFKKLSKLKGSKTWDEFLVKERLGK